MSLNEDNTAIVLDVLRNYLVNNILGMKMIVLLKKTPKNVSTLSKITEKPISSVSESLSQLLEMNAVGVERKGRMRIYSLKNNLIEDYVLKDEKLKTIYELAESGLKTTKAYVESNFEELMEMKLKEKYGVESNMTYEGYFTRKRLLFKLETDKGKKIGVRIRKDIMGNQSELYEVIGNTWEWTKVTPDLDLVITIFVIYHESNIPILKNTEKRSQRRRKPYSLWKLKTGFTDLFQDVPNISIMFENIRMNELNKSPFVSYLSSEISKLIDIKFPEK